MLKSIWTYLQYGSRFSGIEHTQKNGSEIIHVSILKRSKKALDLDSVYRLTSIEDVADKFSKDAHTALVINNDKVLSKTVNSEQTDVRKIVHKAFPNINLEDFYYEVKTQKHIHFVSLCRKDYVKTIIAKYAEHGISVIDLSLGNTLAWSILPFLHTDVVYSSNASILINEAQIESIEKSDVNNTIYNINGVNVSNEQLLSFSGALQTVLKHAEIDTNFDAEKEALENDYKHTRFFNLGFKYGGVLILIILLINFFMFNHYFNKVNDLSQVSEINITTKEKVTKLNTIVTKKQKMVDDLLRSGSSKSSFYAHAVVQSIPDTVLLTTFNYQPLLKRVKPEKPIVLSDNRIIISGRSNDSEAFSDWISELERMDWINKVSIIDYGAINRTTSDFEIKISISQ